MKYLLSVLIPSIALIISSCASQSNNLQSHSTHKDQKLQNALLWEISTKNDTKKSYLFGTMHIIEEKDFFLPSGTMKAIEGADDLVFEIDMNDMMDMSSSMSILQSAFMEDKTTLKDLLSEEDYQIVENHFNKIGLPLMFLERILPMFLTVFASSDIKPEDLKSGKIKSYELELSKIANEKDKNIGGLESIEFQLGIFKQIPYKDQAQMLVETIKSVNDEGNMFDELVKIYKSQDINAMQTVMKEDESMFKYEDILLTQRNKNWIPLMIDYMKKGSAFFAVGAGHLGGENGVIRLLQKQGYTVKPVKGI